MNPRAQLVAHEHDQLEVGRNGLMRDDLERLGRMCDRFPALGTRNLRGIKLRSLCGVVPLGQRQLELLPKIDAAADPASDRRLFVRLLRDTGELGTSHTGDASQKQQDGPLLQVFIAEFLRQVEWLVAQGIRADYLERTDDLRCVRGRVNWGRQAGALAARPDLVACRYEERHENVVENQIVATALATVAAWSRGDLSRRVALLQDVFDQVARIARADDAELVVWHRQNERYRPVVRWGSWILRMLGPSLRAGEQDAPAFLFDMNLLFERHVRRWLRVHAGLNVVRSEYQLLVDAFDAPAFSVEPDLEIRAGLDEPPLIGDVKWKRAEDVPDRGDLFQVLAYAQASGATEALLVYPDCGGADKALPPHRFRFELAHGNLHLNVARLRFGIHAGADRLVLATASRDALGPWFRSVNMRCFADP